MPAVFVPSAVAGSVADPESGSGVFLTPWALIREIGMGKNQDPG